MSRLRAEHGRQHGDTTLSNIKYKLFVYGTLRRGEALADYMVGKFICTCSTAAAEFTMYDLGNYPAIIPRGNRKVWGELYEVSGKDLEELDSVEGVPHLYVRSRIQVSNGDLAFVYFLAPDVAETIKEYKEINFGDWSVYKNNQRFKEVWD